MLTMKTPVWRQSGQSQVKNLAAFAQRFATCVRPFWSNCFHLLFSLLTDVTSFSTVSFVDFEQVNVCWDFPSICEVYSRVGMKLIDKNTTLVCKICLKLNLRPTNKDQWCQLNFILCTSLLIAGLNTLLGFQWTQKSLPLKISLTNECKSRLNS